MKDTLILAIESSCDETAASVVKNGRTILSNVISSQIELHKLYGGVVPEIASRKHIEKINQVIEEALKEADVTLDDLDAIGVTYGPGLVGALLVIVAFLVFMRGGFLIASQASTPFGSLLAAGLTVMIVFQAFLNISCVVGLFPTTGKPLPFISSGGSSLLSSLALVGVLLSISFDSNNEGEYRQRRDNLQVVSRVSPSDRSGRSGRNLEGRDARAHRSSSLERDGYPSLRIVRGSKAPAYATEVRATRTQRR